MGSEAMTMPIGLKRKTGQRGSQAVEMAYVMLPLCAIIFLILDLSWAIFVKATLQQAVREGVRYGVTGRTETGAGQIISIKHVVQRNAIGLLKDGAGMTTMLDRIHVRFYDPDTMNQLSGANSNSGGNLVEVSVEDYNLGPFGPILRSAAPLVFLVRSSDRLEGSPGGSPPPL
jgi:hypothetical protein